MDFSKVARFLDSLETVGVAGCDCAIWQGGELLFRHMHGWADIENRVPISGNTLYRMFSMTKPITCVAMLQLFEEGKFLMTDAISEYLPEFAARPVGVRKTQDAGSITFRQLFTMTAGLTYNLETPDLKKLYAEKPGTYTTRDFVKAVAKEPLAYTPGTHWQYSLAHDVLAALVEVLSGERFSDYCRRHIFEPLGMKDCMFHLPADQTGRSAIRYKFDEETKTFSRSDGDSETVRFNKYQMSENHDSGGAGLTCSLEDYGKFARALTALGKGDNGCRILSSRTMNLMRMDHLNEQQKKDFNRIQFDAYSYGLGVRTMVDPTAAGCLSGIGEYGWAGAAGTFFSSDPANNLTYVHCQQTDPGMEPWVQTRLRTLIYSCLDD